MTNEKIYQANALTSSRYDFSSTEKNVLYRIIQKVRDLYVQGSMKEGWKNMVVRLNSSDFSKIADGNHTQRAKKALRSLRHRDIEIEDAEGNWLNVGYINYAKFLVNEKTYEVEVSKEIMPYLVELVKNFTAYSVTVAMNLRSKYSQRFYELCCQYRQKGGFFLTQLKLRQMLKAENLYKKNRDFRKNIIDVAQKELQEAWDEGNSDCWFKYTCSGKGDAGTYYFSIFSRESEAGKKEAQKEEEYMLHSIFSAAKEIFAKDPHFAERIFCALKSAPKNIRPLFLRLSSLKGKYGGDDLARLLRYILAQDYKIK